MTIAALTTTGSSAISSGLTQSILNPLTAIALTIIADLVSAASCYSSPPSQVNASSLYCGTEEACKGFCAEHCWQQSHKLEEYQECFDSCFQ